MKKADFRHAVEYGRRCGKRFMVVKIATEGNPAPEIIINPAENFREKLAYYDKAYNNDLELLSAKTVGKSVRIVDVLMTNNFIDLNWFAY